MKILKATNEGLSFLLELAMLVGLAYWGYQSTTTVWLKWGLAISLTVAMAILWGFFFAPRANHRLTLVPGTVFSLVLFTLAAAALYQAQQAGLAIALAVLAVINRILVVLWKQW